MEKLALLLIEFEQFEVRGEVIRVGLILDECLDGGEDDDSDSIAFLLVNLDKLCISAAIPLIFIWFSSLMMKFIA